MSAIFNAIMSIEIDKNKTNMRICPHCNNELKLAPNNAFLNCEIYGNSNRVLTICCNKIISISRQISFNIIPITSPDITEDDWGNEIKKK